MKTKHKYKADLLLILFFLALALILFIFISNTGKEASFAVVRINGETVAKYSLSQNGTFVLNNGTNILQIQDGFAYISEAKCPDKLCVKQGKVHSSGQCLTCLPNKLTVTMEGGESPTDFVL